MRSIRDLPYEERLKRLKLPTLEQRRERGDQIQTFKIIKGIDKVDKNTFFPPVQPDDVQARTRGHQYKINKTRSNTTARQNFFTQRTVDTWNNLPDWVVQAETTNDFKVKYDNHQDMGHYGLTPTY